MDYSALEQNAARMVTQVFETPYSTKYPYHNLVHTQTVVAHAKELGVFYVLGERDMCIISLAAWFHDIGQMSGDMPGHEERSVSMMENYFTLMNTPAELTEPLKDCIMVTKFGTLPVTLNEKILCDADTWHFGTPYFQETEFLMKEEMQIRTGKAQVFWHQGSLQLLENHVYFTEYAQLLLSKGKQANIEWLKSLITSG